MRVVIAEDSVLLREGLARLLADGGIEVVAQVGDGPGLVGLRDRVEALGGRLWVQSAIEAGTTVRAELPLGAVSG